MIIVTTKQTVLIILHVYIIESKINRKIMLNMMKSFLVSFLILDSSLLNLLITFFQILPMIY